MKMCSKCKETKEISDFHKHKQGKNGINSICKACVLSHHANWYATGGEDYYTKHRYGVDKTEYSALFRIQRGMCAICNKPPGKKKLGIDHDHITGKVRGLLCDKCNTGIAFLNEDSSLLVSAAVYLEASKISKLLPLVTNEF